MRKLYTRSVQIDTQSARQQGDKEAMPLTNNQSIKPIKDESMILYMHPTLIL